MGRRNRSSLPSKVEMPITPMLDMTFQLLAFFILTFQPQSALEGAMGFTLPTTGQPAGPEAAPPLTEPPLDETANVTVVVKAIRDGVSDGNISALILQVPEGETLVRDLDALRALLRQMKPATGPGQVRIAAESKLKYACVMEVMDACLQSGFANVGFSLPPDWTVQ